jgi:murein endopeptidase
VRECSPKIGGNAFGHSSHETGIDMDIRLPLLPPETNKWTQLKAHNYTELFHFEAAVKQLESIRSTMDPRYVFFNDQRFIDMKLCSREDNHSEHYHVRIKPPARIDGIIA